MNTNGTQSEGQLAVEGTAVPAPEASTRPNPRRRALGLQLLAAQVLVLAAAAAVQAAGDYTLNTLVTFPHSTGYYPYAPLIADSAGNLYGTTSAGGSLGNGGTVFKVDGVTHALTTLVSFEHNGFTPSTTGFGPEDSLLLDPAGNLFGTARYGGTGGVGTVFEVNTVGTPAVSVLYTFNNLDGVEPIGGLNFGPGGNIYGTTWAGGTYNGGTIFKIDAVTHSLNQLAVFTRSNGDGPCATMITDAAGNLYGTAEGQGANGDGMVFELPVGANAVTTLATFDGSNGRLPEGSLYRDSAGNLFGTTWKGGANDLGTIFEVVAGSGQVTNLATFNGTNGKNPGCGLVVDAAGNLYGTTYFGGTTNSGTIFELLAGTHELKTLANFGTGSNTAANPQNSLLFDAQGNLYGTTWGGSGPTALGTVFELSPQSASSTTAQTAVATGTSQATGVIGGSAGSGGVSITFASVTAPGTVTAVANPSLTLTDLANGAQSIQTGSPNFVLPTGFFAQAWDLSFTGSFSGDMTLEFQYDPASLPAGFDAASLAIYHFDPLTQQWNLPAGEIVDTVDHTITLTTGSLSPFVLGQVPEPTTLALLAGPVLAGLLRRRRARK